VRSRLSVLALVVLVVVRSAAAVTVLE